MIEIYKASAGSGKTYRLTFIYIKLVLGSTDPESGRYTLYAERSRRKDGSQSPSFDPHAAVLAITFTNKATEEMKRRILHELGVLGQCERGWSKPSPYLEDFCRLLIPGYDPERMTGAARREEINRMAERLREPARKALRELLFDFSYFHVSTIDAFFQRVLRTFAREANLTGNYEVSIDREEALYQALSNLYAEMRGLDARESRRNKTLARIITYMKQRCSDGKSFNVFDPGANLYGELIRDFNNMLNETYAEASKDLREYLSDEDAISRFSKALREAEATAYVRSAKALGAVVGSDSFAAVQSGFSQTALKAVISPGKWTDPTYRFDKSWHDLPKGLTGIASDTAYAMKKRLPKGLDPAEMEAVGAALTEACSLCLEAVRQTVTRRIVEENLFLLGIMGKFLDQLDEYCQENNTLLLANTNEVLSGLIGNDEVPFIYERMGVQLRHFLIDEFQDTSGLQWRNLLPLVMQSLSVSNDNLIIGDEKQCIYRFRNSDPSLLHSKVQQYVESVYPDATRIRGDKVEENTNWRSSAHVVRFNNTLFRAAAEDSAVLRQYYHGATQRIAKSGLGGYVEVVAYPENISRPMSFEALSLTDMVRDISRELEAGCAPCGIAILTRTRAEGRKAIDFLLQAIAEAPEGSPLGRVGVVSDDAMELSGSSAVRCVISLLRYLVAPDMTGDGRSSGSRVASVVANYQHTLVKDPDILPAQAIARAIGIDDSPIDRLLTDFRTMTSLSLLSLVENIIDSFLNDEIREAESAHIAAFVDAVAEFCQRGEGDIGAFLTWWDSVGYKKNVSANPGPESIRVMTVHKSKGLEFECVHMPFISALMVNIPVNRSKTTDWWEVRPGTGASSNYFPGIPSEVIPPVIPLNRKPDMLHTPFREGFEHFEEEKLLDAVNNIYVAFTRAKRELIIHYPEAPLAKSGSYMGKETLVSQLIDKLLLQCTPDNVESWKAGVGDPATGETLYETPVRSAVTRYYPSDTEDEEPAECPVRICSVGTPVLHFEDKKEEHNVLEPEGMEIDMPSYISLQRSDIWDSLSLEDPAEGYSDARNRGLLLHNIMSNIRTVADVDRAVDYAGMRGNFDASLSHELKEWLRQALSSPKVRPWFNGCSRVLCERPICCPGNKRPDRVVWTEDGRVVVVDYKFGEPSSRYPDQVRGYMSQLRDMGEENVEGYLWYVDSGRIVPVEL